MKKLITMGILALMTTTVMAQGSDSYIVKTKGVKKVETPKTDAKQVAGSTTQEADKPQDFVGRNFPRYGLRDWQDGMRFIIVTHEMGFARNACEKCAFLSEGRLLEYGDSEGLFGHPETPELQDFLARLLEWR